jgi:hypothetical protein
MILRVLKFNRALAAKHTNIQPVEKGFKVEKFGERGILKYIYGWLICE